MVKHTFDEKAILDRNLALEAVRVTEAAALSASRLIGRGDEKAADQAAVDSMRHALNALDIEGTVVIGEGERDEAPMLYIGENVGKGGPKIDIALDPLEGTTITAKGGQNALAVMAFATHGGFLNAPDVYMQKIGRKLGYDYVLSYRLGGPMLFADSVHEITSEIIIELNKEYNLSNK